jgi:type I secretion outer membrane protein, TolC family
MIRRSLVLALAAALCPLTVQAADLLQVYEMARNGDPQLAAAESTRLFNKEGQVQARAALLPQINGQASLSRSRAEADGVSGSITTKRRTYGVDGSQTLFNWSQFANLRAQRALGTAADYDLESANDDLIVRTAATYFNVLVAIESLSAAQTNEAAARKQFDYADKRLEVGLAPITDVHEARAQYDQARADTILARNALEDAYQALTELTGQPVRNLRALPEDFRPELPGNRGDVDQLVADAVARNPALKAQQLQVSAAEASVSAARGGHYPSLSLGASWGKSATWGDSVGGASRDPDATTNSIGLTLNVPIFSGGATQSNVRQAWPSATSPRTATSSSAAPWTATPAMPGRPWWPASARWRHAAWRWFRRRAPTTPRRSAWKWVPAPCWTWCRTSAPCSPRSSTTPRHATTSCRAACS